MKIFICCLISSVFYLTLADVSNVNESVAIATAKANDSKLKRDVSLLKGIYHGPSYKYLPPSTISSLYDSYSGNFGNSAGYSGGIGGEYSSGGAGRGHNHRFSSLSNLNNAAFRAFDYAPASSFTSGHHGFGLTSSHNNAIHGSNHHSNFKGVAASGIGATFGHGYVSVSPPHSYGSGHGPITSSVGYKPHSFVGANSGPSSGYHYSKGISGSFSAPVSPVLSLFHGTGSGLNEEYLGDHVHNGAQEHVFVISNEAGKSHDASEGQQASHLIPTASYLSLVEQHPLPTNSYVESMTALGSPYNKKYNAQALPVKEHAPTYAAGHKGLGYFSFRANKPQVLHTSISGSRLKQPSYSKAPFQPSIFLGAKIEGSGQNDDSGQKYLSGVEAGSDSTVYDYPISPSTSINYQEPSYQQSVEAHPTSVYEPDFYESPKNNEGSVNEISSAPNVNYLPPSNSYGVPYSH